jgi:hypothetical protein
MNAESHKDKPNFSEFDLFINGLKPSYLDKVNPRPEGRGKFIFYRSLSIK